MYVSTEDALRTHRMQQHQMSLQSRKDEARAVSAHAAYEHVHHVHELTASEQKRKVAYYHAIDRLLAVRAYSVCSVRDPQSITYGCA